MRAGSNRRARPRIFTIGRARNSSPASSARATSSRAEYLTIVISRLRARRCAAAAANVLPGTVVRQVFLGASRDYLVEVGDGTQLRVVAPAAENIPQGASVWLHLPPERCLILSG